MRLGTLRRPVLSAIGSLAILVGLVPALAATPALAPTATKNAALLAAAP